MDDSEKDAWKERVSRASEDQVKKALQHLIDRCPKTHNTIAWAIKDAIELCTRPPAVIFETQDSKDDEEVIIAPPHRKSAKKEESQSSSSEDEEIPATNSKHRRSTHRRDKKTKNKLQVKSKESVENELNRRGSSKNKRNKKHKHALKHQIEGQQDPSDGSMERSSKKRNSTVIDLGTSSDFENPEKEQPSHSKLKNLASDDDLDLFTLSEDEPFYPAVPKKQAANSRKLNDAKGGPGSSRCQNFVTDSSDDSSSEDEQHAPVASVKKPSQGGSGMKSTSVGARNGDGGRRAQEVTVSAAKASNHHKNTRTDSLGLDKKRKALDLSVEDLHTTQPVNPAPVIHPSKRPKQNYPGEAQESQRGLKCDKCEKKFPSHELVKHRWICKGKAAEGDDHHNVLEAPADDRTHQSKPIQKDGGSAGDVVTVERQHNMQLPLKSTQTARADRELSKPPPSFVGEPNSLARGPTPLPMVLARSDAATQALSSNCPPPPKPEIFPIVSLGHELRTPRRDPAIQRLPPDLEAQDGRRCIFCSKWFKRWDNSGSVCTCHTGEYRRLTDVNKDQYRLNFGIDPVPPFLAWSCCLRQGKDAPPCRIGRHILFS